jgi:hypothetical protein
VVITFFGVDEGDNRSELYSVVYTVDRTPPGVRPRIQGHLETKEFTVSFALSEGDRVFYTTDGTDPTPASRECRGAFNVSAGATVKYVGVDAAGNRTEVRTLSEIVLPGVTASPPGGIYGRVAKIRLTANLPGKVYYRLESKRQEKGDFLEYAAPVVLNANGMYKLEYYSTDRQGKPSPIKEETYVIDLFPPEIEVYTTRNPVDSTITVHFQSSENAAIYYTQDGTNPFTSPTARIIGNKYFLSRDKIVFKRASEDLQLTFMGEDVAGNKSGLYQFDINLPTVMASPPGGEYNAILNVALVTYNQATVYYTLDNSAPTEYSAIYRQPIPITKKTVVKYFAIDGFGYRGRTGESRYLIDLPPRPAFEIRSDSLLEGLPVVFDASVSVDEEGGPNSLQFQWDFDGDSRWDTEWSVEPRVTRFFRTAGVRRIILRARDSSGQVASVERRVTILRDCPQGMAPLTDGDTAYCMDRYEYPNVKGEKPLTNVTWVDAVMRCRSMGKDLCSRSEWRAACAGSRRGAYPYGSEYRPEECNTENRSLSGSGEYDRCGSDKGVFDLTGNAWEWVLDRDEGYNLIAGGNYYYGRNARCDATFYNLLSNTDKSIGFRCCK